MSAAPGEIRLRDARRSFRVSGDRGRTLKELLLRRGASGPAPVRALDGVTLDVRPGETVGIVGRNGAGKSSTLKVLAGIVPLHSGEVETGGDVVALLELGAGFGRDFTGRENIYFNGALHGLTRADVEERAQRIIDFSELGDFIDVPVRAYSSGMHVRLGFAIAAHLDADILLVDEVLAVGDEGFQRKCLERIAQRIEAGTTLVLVSHDPGAIERVCERVVVLDHGRVAFDGPAPEGLLHYHRMMGTERAPGDVVGPSKHRTVFVQEVELQDAEGRRRASFPTGGPMRMVFLVTVREAVPDAQIVLEVRTAAGHPVFLTRRRLELTARETRLAFDVPRLALLGGDYDLVVSAHGISDPNPGIDRVAGFAVKADADAEGVTDLRGEWRELDAERISG